MNQIELTKQFKRRPLCTAIVTGTIAMAGAVVLSGCISKPVEDGALPTAAKKEVQAAAKVCNPCNPCNPCAAKACNPCNPCAAKACNPCNPCAAKACNPCNPCAAKACNPCNPCAANACNPCNPCAAGGIKAADFVRPAGVSLDAAAMAGMAAKGEQLWNDTSLSSNGLACSSCHNGGALLNASFAQPYPHEVAMPKQQAGVAAVDVDEMVNFCMLAPMQAAPLAWNSDELLALSAYTLELQAGFNPCAAKAVNPCAACNPCNPCAAQACNPCAAKACNPCAAKACNPCAACNPCNPCAAKACNPCNPCNPCAAKN